MADIKKYCLTEKEYLPFSHIVFFDDGVQIVLYPFVTAQLYI